MASTQISSTSIIISSSTNHSRSSNKHSDFFWRRRRRLLTRKITTNLLALAITIALLHQLQPTSATLLPAEPSLLPIVSAPTAAALEPDSGLLYLQPAYDNEIGDAGLGEGGGGYIHMSAAAGSAHHHHHKSFAVAPGVLSPEYDSVNGFDYRREYSPKLAQVYLKYLSKPTGDYSDSCSLTTGSDGVENSWLGGAEPEGAEIDGDDWASAFLKAGVAIEKYERSNQEYLATDPRGLNFSAYVYVATLHAKYNELLTSQLKVK